MDEINNLKQRIEALEKEVLSKQLQIDNLKTEKNIFLKKQLSNENRVYALANASPNAIIQLNESCELIFINDVAKQLIKVNNDEIYLGKNIVEFVAEEVFEDIKNKVETVFKTNVKVESILHHNNKYLKIIANIINDEYTKSALIITTDITEQFTYETELRFKSVLLQKVYDESANSLLVLDAQTIDIISCNKTTFKMFDFNDNTNLEIIKNHVLSAKVSPNTKKDNEKSKQLLEKFGTFTQETEFKTFTGRKFNSNYQVSIFEIDGKNLLFCKITDITEAIKINKKLLVESQKQKLHLEQSPLGYLEWNANFEVAEWNPSAEKIFGYTRNEAMGRHASFIIQESERIFVNEYWKTLTTNIKGSRTTHYNINKNNELLFIEWYNTPLFDENGNLLGISCLVDNVTEKLKAEEELKHKTEFLETIYEEAFDSIMLFKPDSFEVINCNKRSFEIFEVDNLEQLNILMPTARKKRQTSNERKEAYETIAKKEIIDKDIEFITAKGKSIWLTMFVKLITFNDQTVELVRLTDVSEIKKINRELKIDKQKQRIQIQESPLGYVEWNSKFQVAEWNPTAEKIFGYTKEEALGKSAQFILPPWEKNNTAKIWQTILAYESGHQGIYNNLNKKNELITVDWYDTPLFDEEGNVLGVSSLLIDITEKIKKEEELKNKTAFLETIYEEAFDAIMLFEPDSFEVIECNKRSFEIFETENIEQLNDLMPRARKVKQTKKERNQMFDKILGGGIFDNEIEFITYKGNSVWVTMLIKLIVLDGKKVELVRITDVSDLKKINSKLNLDKQKQKLLVEQSPLGYLEIDAKNIIKEWNPSAEKIFEFTREEAIGKNINIIVPDNLKGIVERNISELNSNKSSSKNTHQNITKSNQLISVEWYNSTIYDENGKYIGLGSLINDISDKIKQEEDMKYKNLFLETIFEEAFDAIMLFKPNTFEVITCNKRSFEIFETQNLEQLNQHLPTARKKILSDEQRQEMFNEIEKQEVYDTDVEFVTYKGNTVWLTMLVKLIKLDGEPVELVRITDVSELKKINSRLNLDRQKQILQVEQSPLGYIEWNTNFEVAEWNPSAEKIFGYTKEEAMGKHAVFIIPDEVKQHVGDVWENLKNRRGGNRSTNKNITKNNEEVILEWYNTPLFDDNGRLLGVSSLVDNITEQIKAQKEIEKQLQEKEVMLSEIHHRVKNNLAVISGLLFMHSEHVEDESVKLILKESQSRIKSMAIIHEQLYQTENFGNINVNVYLKELVKKIASTFNSANKTIDLDIDVNDFSMPISQALIIGLIINELVINSYKYAFDEVEKGKIKIRFEKKVKHILRVSDNGIGYKEDYNFEKSNSLGLNLVKILAKQLKGDVLFENKKGAYCTLIFN